MSILTNVGFRRFPLKTERFYKSQIIDPNQTKWFHNKLRGFVCFSKNWALSKGSLKVNFGFNLRFFLVPRRTITGVVGSMLISFGLSWFQKEPQVFPSSRRTVTDTGGSMIVSFGSSGFHVEPNEFLMLQLKNQTKTAISRRNLIVWSVCSLRTKHIAKLIFRKVTWAENCSFT